MAASNLSFSEEKILSCQLSIVAKKDFATEVRALADIRKFVSDAFILMELSKTQVSEIVHETLEKLAKFRGLPQDVVAEAKALLFVEPSNQLVANTMQGLYKTRIDGRLAYDNSWLVATCNLATISKRYVAIAKLAQPTNFGRQSQEVRVLIVVLTPNKDKLTKSAWETGRTFATMLTDIHFRRRLYRAKSEYEFKVELLSMAELLAAPADTVDELCKRQAQYLTLRHSLRDTFDSTATSAARLAAAADGSAQFAPSEVVVTQQPTIKLNKSQTDNAKLHSTTHHLADSLFARKLDADAPQAAAATATATATTTVACLEKPGQQDAQRALAKPALLASNQNQKAALAGCRETLAPLCSGLVSDYKRRARVYWSDFADGVRTSRSLYKTTSTTVFLYFSVLLPCIAFGVVDTNNTNGAINLRKTMAGQAAGGLLFALLGGQPLIVLMTTAPLCIYVKVIFQISQDFHVDFLAFYACVGLWMCGFLTLMTVTNASNLMKHCTRSTEDIFAIFTAFAFGSDGIKEAMRSFRRYYYEPSCYPEQMLGSASVASIDQADSLLPPASAAASIDDKRAPAAFLFAVHQRANNSLATALTDTASNDTTTPATFFLDSLSASSSAAAAGSSIAESDSRNGLFGAGCQREICVLFLFLMCGTLWLANSFSSFNQTPYLSPRKREIIKDYALAFSVLIFSFVGSYLFSDIKLGAFEFGELSSLQLARLDNLSSEAILLACPLGFMLAVLFYIDQNICGAMVNNAPYKLKKGDYFHLDLLVLAILNAFLSLFGFPWMHGKLPHSHLHSKALADYEERVDEGHVHQTIVNIRETRLTGISCSLLIALSFLTVPYPLSYVPLPVLSGVFLYTALSEFKSNSMVERVCLLFTEQAAYPPNHYIRRCPQRKIHLFTLMQLIQLAVVSFVGFYPNPYVNMAYPLVVATFVPLREAILPSLIDAKYLNSLDHHASSY